MKVLAVSILIVFFVSIRLFLDSTTVSAITLSWTNGEPTIVSDMLAPAGIDTSCPTFSEDVYIDELQTTRPSCIYGNAKMRIGTFFDVNQRKAFISKPYTSEVSILQGVCESFSCQYSADQDILVTQQRVGQFAYGIIVFKHVSSRIKMSSDVSGRIRYFLSAENPDYEFRIPDKNYIWSPSYALSNNGEWLAVEIRGQGTALIRTTDFLVRQINSNGYGYDRGYDPTEEMAVSNDGRTVVVTGQNAGFSVFEVTPSCGQPLMQGLTLSPSATPCKSSDLGIGNLFFPFHSAHRPHFSDDGTTVSIVVMLWNKPARLVSFSPMPLKQESIFEYIALGDSFVSGEGETAVGHYLGGAHSGFDNCHISDRSYPFLIATISAIPQTKVRSVACSGARIDDIIGSNSGYLGQDGRLAAQMSRQDQQAKSIDTFMPGNVQQGSFLEHYRPTAATVGIGGNDAGLMGKLRVCAMPGTCEWAIGDGLRKTAKEIQRLFGKLVTLYTELIQKSPQTRLYAVGYPAIIKPGGVCDPVTGLLFDHDERMFMYEGIHYLNIVIRAAAEKVGIAYIDIEKSFIGSELCGGGLVPSMNSLRFGSDVALFSGLPSIKLIGSDSFHPTPPGHALIASAITRAYPDIRTSAYCSDNQTVCPAVKTAPEPTVFWTKGQTGQSIANSYFETFATQSGGALGLLTIVVRPETFIKNSTVSLEIHSDTLSLGTFQTNELGGLDVRANVPLALGDGLHTLHLMGRRDDGSMLDLYQFISKGFEGVALPNANSSEKTPADKIKLSTSPLSVNQNTVGTDISREDSNIQSIVGIMSNKIVNVASQVHRIAKDIAHSRGGYLGWIIVGLSVVGLIVTILLIIKWAKRNG